MQLLITRETYTCVTTPGQLFLVNGNSKRWLAYTLEDVVRVGAKVHGRIYQLRTTSAQATCLKKSCRLSRLFPLSPISRQPMRSSRQD